VVRRAPGGKGVASFFDVVSEFRCYSRGFR